MSIYTYVIVSLLNAPVATDREVAPVEVAAPEPAPEPAPEAVEAPAPGPVVTGPVYVGEGPVAKPMPPRPPMEAPVVPPPDRPIRWRIDVVGSFGGTVIRDPAWRAFDNDRTALPVGGTIRGDTRLGKGRVFLGGGLTYSRFRGLGDPYQSISTRLLVREPLGFVRMSVVALEGLDVFAQAGGGVSIVDVDIESNETTSQRSFLPVAEGLGGVAVYLPKRWLSRRGASRVTAGLEFGAGYTWRGDLDVRPRVNVEEEPIDTRSVSLGDVALRGVTWRLGLFIRFQ